MTSQSFEREVGGRKLIIETGKFAGQANGAVTVSYGDSVVLVTACTDKKPREGIDFLPLTIDYEERLYAAGKIPGGFIRREGRPSQEATLAARMTDRPLRPLLPKTWRNEIQIIITVLSVDHENDTTILAVIGSSAALTISEIPFDGPVSASRVGYIDGELILNPTLLQLETSLLDLVVVSKGDEIVMIEAGAQEVSEDIACQAMRFGHEANQAILAMQEELHQACGKPKLEAPVSKVNQELVSQVSSRVEGRLAKTWKFAEKHDREEALSNLGQELIETMDESFDEQEILAAFDKTLRAELRSNILEKGQRIGGRSLTEVRPISCEVGLLPRTHGTGLFVRGQTQVLTITTLGSVGKAQKLDGLGLDEPKYFMHHYNFPPYSSGEVKRIGTVGRREIGHGALAEKALIPVLPKDEEFPYTIRLVSEVLSSSGSTSMASACASSLSLMDAGVPIKRHVAGIAMGLVTDDQGNYAILTDIEGIEDAYGDMDFKIAGTAEGITAMQLDTKLKGLTLEILEKAIRQAKDARLFILDRMQQTINTNRGELSPFAPRVYQITIDQDKIGAVIGSGGKTIRAIIAETKASVDIEDDGTVRIGSANEEDAQKAIKMIENLTKEVEIGEVYTGKVVRLMNFGAFVEILPGKDGLVHISELADHHVGKVEDEVQVGDVVTVRVINIDHMGRINLSRRAASEDATQEPRRQDSPAPNRRFNQRDEGPSRPFRNKRF
ncbi:MAG: polyribonucleotide nucleotidyltransferase [Chloroflexi bacterium]|nr:polyribonucleotide nucleotidyltransferase [Chloroflexota bacterium]